MLDEIPGYFELKGVLTIFAETPIFVGGEQEESIIDLTLQRDKLTNLPIIRGTSIKGALRSYEWLSLEHDSDREEKINSVFGASDRVGSVVFLDAFILLFPTISDREILVFATSPHSISNYGRILAIGGESFIDVPTDIETKENGSYVALAPKNSPLVGDIELAEEFSVNVRESEIDLTPFIDKVKASLPTHSSYNYIKRRIERNLMLLNDKLFKDIVERGLIRVTRIRVDPYTKAVRRGALFTQELIPQYTILVSGVMTTIRGDKGYTKDFLNKLEKGIRVNLGGDETTGKGLVHLKLVKF